MGNLCSIFHKKFARLYEITGNYNKAIFLDKCIYWWQISTYTLNNDNMIWFTRSIEEMAKELSLSETTIGRYLNEFVEKKLLDKTCKLSSAKKGNVFEVKKRLYIHVTDTLLALTQELSNVEKIKNTQKSSFFTQDDDIENANLTSSLNKDKDYNIYVNNNTVSDVSSVNNLKPSKNIQTLYPKYKIEDTINGLLNEREVNYIKGMMHNLKKQHQVNFSNPEQTFAEIVFSITQESQLKGIEGFQHKVNIIAKLIKSKSFRTPKGFFNHAHFSKAFKEQIEERDTSKNTLINQANIEFSHLEKRIEIMDENYVNTLNEFKEYLFYDKKDLLSEDLKELFYLKLHQLCFDKETLLAQLKSLSTILHFEIPKVGTKSYEALIQSFELTENKLKSIHCVMSFIEKDCEKITLQYPKDTQFVPLSQKYKNLLQSYHDILSQKLNRLTHSLFDERAA